MSQHRILLVFGFLLLLGLFGFGIALAQGPLENPGVQACLACHSNPTLTYRFPSGEVWPLYVDSAAYAPSVHGVQNMACSACHTDIQSYPHPPLQANSVRSYQLTQYRSCIQCHRDVYEKSLDGIHGKLLAAGNFDAAICTDCHGAHDVTPAHQPRTRIPRSCSKCHGAVNDEYLGSVHGEALVNEDNPDVPTCVECHGVHNQPDPTTAAFRINSPQLCARCHADETMMAKYDLSTDVFNTYLADFHGTTVTLFRRQTPDVPTNAPVCYDCHGVHNMLHITDPNDPNFKANVLEVCRHCHPTASANFPASWLSHYEPSLERYPLVYYVNLFYRYFVPIVLGGMALFVAIDIVGRTVRRARHNKAGV